MPEDEIVPKEFVGCKIDWKEGKDVTMEQVRGPEAKERRRDPSLPACSSFPLPPPSACLSLPLLLTVLRPSLQVKKRVKSKGKGDKSAKAFVTELLPCDSFFNTFDPPKVWRTEGGRGHEQWFQKVRDARGDSGGPCGVAEQLMFVSLDP